ncbi:cupredoxin domain-containing protein [Pseudogulbenkiania subflava]|uniref:Plastocyanin n=1 Tax=Pseudogulbenkiania subflava DSM 22618 TaxID=1123014 RepID=A0A1Y6BV67_9NEIS|nr:quinol oxidase [Pseudogulbenkiania subflava]SMF22783.1 Plastocyanin [Pseudogulbenkiania subflava DSM 22618]
MHRTRLILAGLALALGLSLLAGGARAADEPYRVPVASDGVQRVAIVGGSYFFRPAHIVVKAGTPVELSVKVEAGLIPHRFVLKLPPDQVAIDSRLGEEPRTFRFTPTMAGRYPFHCPNKLLFFKSHEEKGMAGVLEVVE